MSLVDNVQPTGAERIVERTAAKRQRIAERIAQLCAEYDATPAQRQLLAVVAGHLDDAQFGRNKLTRTRATNSAERLLRSIPRKQPKRPANAAEWYDANDD
jgi:hypothetical protein